MHRYGVIPSTFHQCFKGIWKGKVVEVPASVNPFLAEEAHFTEAVFFNEFADREVSPEPLNAIPLPDWTATEGPAAEPSRTLKPATNNPNAYRTFGLTARQYTNYSNQRPVFLGTPIRSYTAKSSLPLNAIKIAQSLRSRN